MATMASSNLMLWDMARYPNFYGEVSRAALGVLPMLPLLFNTPSPFERVPLPVEQQYRVLWIWKFPPRAAGRLRRERSALLSAA
jgi:hypothetical protein